MDSHTAITADERKAVEKGIVRNVIVPRAKEEQLAAAAAGQDALASLGVSDFESSARINFVKGTQFSRWEIKGQGRRNDRATTYRIEIDTSKYELGDYSRGDPSGVRIVSLEIDGKQVATDGPSELVGSWVCAKAIASSGTESIPLYHTIGFRGDHGYLWVSVNLDNNRSVESVGKWTFEVDEEISTKRGTTTGLLSLTGGVLKGSYVISIIDDTLVLTKPGDPDPPIRFTRKVD